MERAAAPTGARRPRRLSWVVLGLHLAALACGRGVPGSSVAPRPTPTTGRDLTGSITYEGLDRRYRLRLPGGQQPSAPTALVVALHGGGGDADQMCDLVGGLSDLVDQEGFLLLCPQGVKGHWNDGRLIDRYQAHRDDIDDVGFVLSLVAEIRRAYEVEPRRVYVTGASNGGMMTYRLACETPGTFAAAAAIIANLPLDLNCQPSTPISILIMNGTEDPLMPYQGGQVHFLGQELGAVRSAESTARFWAEADGCEPQPERTDLEQVDPDDGTRLRLDRYSPCAGGSEVVFYTVVGGGHTWPGGRQYAGEWVIGPVSREGHMGAIVWDFFSRH